VPLPPAFGVTAHSTPTHSACPPGGRPAILRLPLNRLSNHQSPLRSLCWTTPFCLCSQQFALAVRESYRGLSLGRQLYWAFSLRYRSHATPGVGEDLGGSPSTPPHPPSGRAPWAGAERVPFSTIAVRKFTEKHCGQQILGGVLCCPHPATCCLSTSTASKACVEGATPPVALS
jgi:hypothetical protein